MLSKQHRVCIDLQGKLEDHTLKFDTHNIPTPISPLSAPEAAQTAVLRLSRVWLLQYFVHVVLVLAAQ